MPPEHVIGEGAAAEGAQGGQRTQADIDLELQRLELLEAELGEDDGIAPGLPKPAAPSAADATRQEELTASRKGWVPKAKWVSQGKDASQWVDAATFNKRGEAFVNNLQAELAAVRRELEEFKGTAKAFAQFQKELMAKKDDEHQLAMRQLRLQHKEAIRNGEDDEALRLEDQIDELKAGAAAVKAEVKAPTPNEPDPQTAMIVEEWVEDGNLWFRENDKLRKFALALGDQMIAAGETSRGREFLDKVGERMRKEFPKTFRGTGSTPAGDKVSGSGNAGGGSNTGSGNYSARDLPAADRALMRQFIADGMYTEEEFLKSYFSR